MSTRFEPTRLLRLGLVCDAVASGGTGLLLVFAAGALADLFGLSRQLLFVAGLAFLPWAALVGWLGTRATLTSATTGTVVALNAAYVAGCVAALWFGWLKPNGLGIAFVLVQAAAVLAFTQAQFLGLRQSSSRALASA